MTEPTNLQRAAWAEQALVTYAEQKSSVQGYYDTKDIVLTDLLCDLMHLADTMMMPFAELVTAAQSHYEAETSEGPEAVFTKMIALLTRAEDFISGFEDDPIQEGIPELLEEIREVIAT